MTTRDTLLGTRRFPVYIPLAWATAGTAGEEPAFRAPIRLQVTAVRFIAKTAFAGHGTNYATVSLQNKGSAGTGTTEIASKAFDTPTTDDVAAFDEAAITLSATAANLILAQGDVVSIKKAVAAAGLAIDGIIIIEATPVGS
jgi:hypothetical protein